MPDRRLPQLPMQEKVGRKLIARLRISRLHLNAHRVAEAAPVQTKHMTKITATAVLSSVLQCINAKYSC